MTVWLLAWLWQGVALTLIAALLVPRRTNAATRHLAWWAVLAAVNWLGWMSSPYGGLTPVPVPGSDPNGTESALIEVRELSPHLVSILLGIWVAVSLVKLLRLLPAVHTIYALRDRCRSFPQEIESQLPLWLEAKGLGRRADLVICDAVPGATVLGFQRPCIALPSSLVAALGVEEIDQIVLHEYAHVRRRDDWTRLAQALLQAALWIHPAVAYIGRALNREREVACDEWVIARTGLPKAYARCIVHAAEVHGRLRGEPLLLSTFLGGQHDLVQRVNRLLAVKGRTRRKISLVAVTSLGCAIVLISSQLNAVPLLGDSVELLLPQVAGASGVGLLASTFALRATADKPADRPARQVSRTHKPAFALTSHVAMAGKPYEPHELYEPNEPNELNAPSAPSFLTARSFEGAYERPFVPQATPNSTNGWRAVATPGLAVAEAARKTGVGLAGAVSRASVALARRF